MQAHFDFMAVKLKLIEKLELKPIGAKPAIPVFTKLKLRIGETIPTNSSTEINSLKFTVRDVDDPDV